MVRIGSLLGSFGALSVLLVACTGCGEKLATVTGKVTYQGKSVTSGVVLLANADNTKIDRAPIGADGSYTATRVPFGELRVAVEPGVKPIPTRKGGGYDKVKVPENAPGVPAHLQGSGGEYVDVPKKYRDVTTSDLKVNVDSSTKTFDINLQ